MIDNATNNIFKLNNSQNHLSNKEKLSNLSNIDKYKYLDNLRIEYPKFKSILEKIEECQSSIKIFNQPKCLSIIGPSGSGKTTITQIHMRKYPDLNTSEATFRRILYSRVPCPARIGSLPSKILYDLGDPFYNKRSNITLQTQRLYELIKKCKVELIILDEVQHLVDRNSEKLIRDSSDWFKELIDNTKIPIIFLGMPDSKKIFIENTQLANRVQLYEEIKPFEYNDTYLKLLHLFDLYLPISNISNLAEKDYSKRIYYATKGLMKHIRDLIVESTVLAIKNNQDTITMPLMLKHLIKYYFLTII